MSLCRTGLLVTRDYSGSHNHTAVTEFIPLGITDCSELPAPLCTVPRHLSDLTGGKLGYDLLSQVDFRLQTPMYFFFFLRHLPFTDLAYSTAMGPKMLINSLWLKV